MPKVNNNHIPKKFRDLDESFVGNIIKDNNHSFKSFPKGLKFYGKENSEEIILVVRSHWIVLLTHFFISLLILILPFIIFLAFRTTFSNIPFLISLIVVCTTISLTIATNGFIKWFYNVSIITNRRVVDLDFINIMAHSMTEAPLDKIEDVTHKQVGLLGSIFDIGSVYIQTAGAKSELEFHNIPRPRDVQDILVDLLALKKKGRI